MANVCVRSDGTVRRKFGYLFLSESDGEVAPYETCGTLLVLSRKELPDDTVLLAPPITPDAKKKTRKYC